jgi:hypothetical protein
MAMFMFFSIARVRNNHLFAMWSLIGAAVSYGSSPRASARYASVLFGHACHLSTLMRLTLPFRERLLFRERVTTTLNQEVFPIHVNDNTVNYTVLLLVFDNAQKNYPFKFQRGGQTSTFVKVTSRCFIKVWQGPWMSYVFRGDPHATITYVNQAVPSPIGMATKFESIDFDSQLHVTEHIVGDVDALPVTMGQHQQPWSQFEAPDFSGKRTCAYFRLLRVSVNLRCLWRHLSLNKSYAFQPDTCRSNEYFAALSALLTTQRQHKGLLFRAGSFQRRAVLAYRGLRPKALSLTLPVLLDDETTKAGIAAVVTKLLVRSGQN